MSAVPHPQLVGLLQQARRVLLFTGAGISTGSGIPDYRGPQGVWQTRQPVYYQDFMSSEAARIEYWEQKLLDYEGFGHAAPNAVHHAAAALERAGRLELLVTQNIDGLHSRAGTSADRLVELHGTNGAVQCQACGARSDPAPHMAWFRQHRRCPRCACGGPLKSATISFGQALDEQALQRALSGAAAADLVVALGSTLSVHPAASIPLLAARRRVPYVIINRGPTEQDGLPQVTLRLEGDVALHFPPAVAAALP